MSLKKMEDSWDSDPPVVGYSYKRCPGEDNNTLPSKRNNRPLSTYSTNTVGTNTYSVAKDAISVSPSARSRHQSGRSHVPPPKPGITWSAITSLLCGIYALLLVVLGIVFPITTSLTNSKNSAGRVSREPQFYLEFAKNGAQAPEIPVQERRSGLEGMKDIINWNVTHFLDALLLGKQTEVFHLYLYIVSLIFLIYLHCYLLRQKGDDPPTRGNIRLVANNQLDSPDKSAFAVQENSEVGSSHSGKPENRSRTPSEVDLVEPNYESRPVSYDSAGVNFYLRLGAIGFGAGAMILDGFRIAQVFEADIYWYCYGLLGMVMPSMHLVFTFFQTFFLFKNHRIVVNKHKAFVRFGLTHIIATNICIWALATVVETAEDFQTRFFGAPLEKGNGTNPVPQYRLYTVVNGSDVIATPPTAEVKTLDDDASVNMQCFQTATLARKASPYLFPCVIQYSLIAAAVVFKMYQNVGKIARHEITMSEERSSIQRDCHKANKGLFLGLFIAILTLISISCFFVFDKKMETRETASMIFYITEITLLFLSCSVVIIGFFKLQQLKFTSHDDNSFEAPLLVIALFGLCIMNTFCIVSSAASIDNVGLIAILSLGTSLLAFMQASSQTIFILDGLRRCAENDDQIRRKPGRTLVTFLLLCNLSLWVVGTFEAKKADTVTLHTKYYGMLPWGIVSHLCIPLIIFFRFHSVVCLSEIWVSAYVMKKRDL